jgi:hypothetical protein
MNSTRAKYYHERLSTLRNVLDVLISELENEVGVSSSSPAPDKHRKNFKSARVSNYEINATAGKWKKPQHLKKTHLKIA